MTSSLGWNVPVYHEPVAAKTIGFLVAQLGGIIKPEQLLAAISIGCGLISAGALSSAMWNRLPETREPEGGHLAMALLAMFCVPAGFVFFGHIETYPVVAAFLSLGLMLLSADLASGRIRFRTGALLALLPFVHVETVLIYPAILLSSRISTVTTRGAATAFVLLAIAAVTLSTFRDHTILSGRLSLGSYGSYIVSLLNGWALIGIPILAVVWPVRQSLWQDRFARMLILFSVLCLALFLFVIPDLGPYTDLDLLTPAYIGLSFLIVPAFAITPERIRRRLVVASLISVPFLAAWLTLARSPVGEGMFEAQLNRNFVGAGSRMYGYQVLSASQAEGGRLSDAIASLRAALMKQPDTPGVLGRIGILQLQQGDTASAVGSLERAVAGPGGRRHAGKLAEIYIRRGAPDKAIILLENDRGATLSDGESSASLAIAYFRSGVPESTVAVSRNRLRQRPDDLTALNNLAAGLLRLGRFSEGLDALKSAARLDPENPAWPAKIAAARRQIEAQSARP